MINSSDKPKNIENIAFKWKLLLSLTDILTALIEQNIKHFGEAHNTLFTSDPLQQIFEYASSNDFVQKVKDQLSLLQDLYSLTNIS